MSTICFYAQFVASKVGVNSLTVTWDVEQITRSDGTRSALVTGGATTITVGRRGLYGYRLASADLSLYDYVATAITATTTVDQQEIAAIGMVIPDALVSVVETDTADIQTRLPAALIGGRMDATVGAMAANTLTASALATDAVTEISTAISSTAGSGALTTTVTVNDENAQPLDGVEVWVTSDSAGTTVVAGTLTTNAAGVVTFMLDAGTYYLWRQLSRYNFTNPTTIVVS